MPPPIKKLFVLDTNAPWVRQLVGAFPEEVNIEGFRVYNGFAFPGGPVGLLTKTREAEQVSKSWRDHWQGIPGWHKAFRLSSWLVLRRIRIVARRSGAPAAVLFTLPWYAKVAEQIQGCAKAYYAHDSFRFFGWDTAKVIRGERLLMDACDFGLAVARLVAADLKQLSRRPVHYFPMATAWHPGTVDGMRQRAVPPDIAGIPAPRVGCVGQISSRAYDWDLIRVLCEELPHVQFVFIGPIFEEGPQTARIRRLFNRPNIHWLGPKKHPDLPLYINQFDVCVNLLKVSDHNNRRCPLRLFDYLTTDRPVISTAIAEAYNHVPHLAVADSSHRFVEMLREALRSPNVGDLHARWDYIRAHTWSARAEHFMRLITGDADAL